MKLNNNSQLTLFHPLFSSYAISEKLNVMTNCKMEDNDAIEFTHAVRCVNAALLSENVDFNTLLHATVIFTENGFLEFSEEDDNTYATTTNIITYRLNKIRPASNKMRMFAYTEELCHHFWYIEDEICVKHKVLEVLNLGGMKCSIDDMRKEGINVY